MTSSERRASGAPSESTGQTTTTSVEAPRAPGGEPIDVREGQVDAVASQGGSPAAPHLSDYLEAVFGDAEGTAFVAVGSEPHVEGGRYKHGEWKETRFAWPSDAVALRTAVRRGVHNGADVYVCPYLMRGTRRAKGDAVERTKVHADIDGATELDRIRDLGGYAVASGTPGHGHVYVDLDQDVPVSWHEVLCRGLGVYMGDADAKVSDNDLLRPPDTMNHKPVAFGTGAPTSVEWLVHPSGYRWDPEELAQVLGVTLPHRSGRALKPLRQPVVKLDTVNVSGIVSDALAHVSGDRSADTMRVVRACVGAGLTLDQTRAVVAQRSDLAERLAERKDDDVLRCWTLASDSRARRSLGRGSTAGRGAAVIPLPVAAGQQLASDTDAVHRGQTRIAYRLAQSHGHRLMHVHGLGWHVWDGRRWIEDDRGEATRAVLDVLRTALSGSLGDHDLQADVRRCESASGITGVLQIAAALEAFAVTVQDLDHDPYLLNVANGTLDLRTLELRPHDPADRITKVTGAAYDPGATGPLWAAFLERVLPDADVRGFLQRYVGLALCGRVLQHVLAILTGTGRNGKGVFYGAVAAALGDYASTAEPDLFMHRENAHPTGEMDLLGLRWVVVSESDQGRRLAEATVKRLTGGDQIKARRMRQDFVAFAPSHTAALVTNHLPKVSGDDPALWARLRVVPFEVVIPTEEQDPHLAERLELETAAILAWAVQGWRHYEATGLAEPSAVRKATDAYQAESDAVARFIEECCVVGPIYQASASALWMRWLEWRKTAGAQDMSMKALGQALEMRGFTAAKGGGGRRIRKGIGLITELGEDADLL